MQRATELLASKRYGRAFDEARIANSQGAVRRAGSAASTTPSRVEFVNHNMMPVSPDYEKEHRNVLEQIVREIQGIGHARGR